MSPAIMYFVFVSAMLSIIKWHILWIYIDGDMRLSKYLFIYFYLYVEFQLEVKYLKLVIQKSIYQFWCVSSLC